MININKMLLILAHIPDVMANHLTNRSTGGPNNIRNAEYCFLKRQFLLKNNFSGDIFWLLR